MSEYVVPILESGKSFTPFVFYSHFLKKVAEFYRINSFKEKIIFKLINENEIEARISEYYIDPISIPLLLSLCEQLSKFHKQPIELFLYNNSGTEKILNFLAKSDFFDIAGDKKAGKNIFKFDWRYLENYKHKNLRPEHKVRSYSLSDENLKSTIEEIQGEENKRDYLVEYFTYKVIQHFEVLLTNNPNTEKFQHFFIEILAELITNGVLHSQSNTHALMFADIYKSKFSISDNGVGLSESLNRKDNSWFYSKFELTKRLKESKSFKDFPDGIQNNLFSLFETLYFSMLKDRKGLFDLMCNVVINCSGYFRLHTENCQIIVSNRMVEELSVLYELRISILKNHNEFVYDIIDKTTYEREFIILKNMTLVSFHTFYNNIMNKYQHDIKFSSIRIFEVKFKGVHIEVEIPNLN